MNPLVDQLIDQVYHQINTQVMQPVYDQVVGDHVCLTRSVYDEIWHQLRNPIESELTYMANQIRTQVYTIK
jgi:hypothetical protein